MDSSLKNDAFVKAVSAIARNDDAKFFLDWLMQCRVNALMEVSDGRGEDLQRKIGASDAYGDIVANVMHAMKIAEIKTPLAAAVEGAAVLRTRSQKNLFGKIKGFFRRRS